jgi:hypothetical protein
MIKVLLYVIALLCLYSCSKKSTGKTTQSPPIQEQIQEKPAPVITKDVVKEEPKKNQLSTPSVILSFQRTTCYGKCPAFKILLYSDGLVRYDGIAFVDKKGVFETRVGEDFIKKIYDKSKAARFWDMNDLYPSDATEITDIPKTITYVKMGNDSKKITDNFDAPKALIDFEKWLEQAFDTLNWQAVKD